jgi:hypothetical protein
MPTSAEWKNEMADMTWLYRLSYDGLSAAVSTAITAATEWFEDTLGK